jgi:hypothetical protein
MYQSISLLLLDVALLFPRLSFTVLLHGHSIILHEFTSIQKKIGSS